MSFLVVDRYHPAWRRRQQARVDGQQLREIGGLSLLEGEELRALSLFSLGLFAGGTLFFVALNLLAYRLQHQLWLAPFTWGSTFIWIICNILAYCLILPIHELVHGLCILFWGGKPHFGARLPLALYCGARDQLFRRSYYIVIALAPFILLTAVGIVVTLLYPGLASYLLLGWTGNFAGAAGDLLVACNVARLPEDTLVEDTETGYTAWGSGAL